ncbi:ras GTPase-activating protein-binding protein 2 [Trichonephila inaurata madagascariensis]|uniref:Ras GTPase-activating protein-binding protein 2 n=1 Tax=Trichonephila inaurata madagascariensis TaxID=2747483 RepID=A0A8X6XFL2_9ARAC|nr:ras GTPase-activating protein-binding protein 2 [Trichonephila inaurata madagascariensis]
MHTPPSEHPEFAQYVAFKFIRFYYTQMNENPLLLHNLYSDDSSFVHSGLDQPGQKMHSVIGQKDIHECIMQLNFKDCHAKIRQVKSQAILGEEIVVQVTGEFSNNGKPMRPFLQTVILVKQPSGKYYVSNDIFCYLDDIFPAEDNEDVDEDVVTGNFS